MTMPPPAWQPPAPQARPSKWKIAGFGCGALVLLVIVLAIVGAIIGPPKKTAAASPAATSQPASSPAPPSPSVTASPTPAPSTAKPTTAAAAPATHAATTTAKPTPHSALDLVFSSGLTGSALQPVGVLPVATGVHSDYNPPAWGTQCAMPASDGAWSAAVGFQIKGITWEVNIGASGFGTPKAGSHPALPQTLTGGSNDDPNAVSISVISNKSPDGQDSAGATQYAWYTPQDHNNGAGTVVVNPDLTSGTLDIWLTDGEPDFLVFHLTGRWSCA